MKKLQAFIHTHCGLSPQAGPVLAGLSGGADSVVMLHILHTMGFEVEALHCNFHLRGDEADRDERFARQFCQGLGIACHVQHFATRQYAAQHHLSIEMAARDLRYQWFEQMRLRTAAQAICVGHHLDDQAETLLLNLLRGTGLRGLAGIKPRQGYVARPLLQMSKQQVLHYATQHHLHYVTDSSNLHADVLRNRIRLELMPHLCQIEPNAPRMLARAAQHVGQALPHYQRGVELGMSEAGFTASQLSLAPFRQCGCPQALLWEWLSPCGFNAATVHNILAHLSAQPGKMWCSATHRLLLDRHRLLLSPLAPQPAKPQLVVTPVERITHTGPHVAYVDAHLLSQPLQLRLVHCGDWFIPFGMKGRRLVSNFLTDLKFSRFQKEAQWAAVSGSDIVWLVGLRADNRFRVSPHTRQILRIEIEQPNPQ